MMTKLVEIGLLCVQTEASVRPTMEEVVGMLLDTSSLTLPVLEMRARMNAKSPDFAGLDRSVTEDHDTSETGEFIS